MSFKVISRTMEPSHPLRGWHWRKKILRSQKVMSHGSPSARLYRAFLDQREATRLSYHTDLYKRLMMMITCAMRANAARVHIQHHQQRKQYIPHTCGRELQFFSYTYDRSQHGGNPTNQHLKKKSGGSRENIFFFGTQRGDSIIIPLSPRAATSLLYPNFVLTLTVVLFLGTIALQMRIFRPSTMDSHVPQSP